jgi:UDP-N-acetylmuramoyl-tripeptide--D-alanyl-D-alanine ligase
MTVELWTWDELLKAVPFAVAEGEPKHPITGFSIDTRSLQPGDVFVALKDQRDGHEFVTTAFKAGAAAAIVGDHYRRQAGDGALLRAADPLKALQAVGIAARTRLAPGAGVIAVTGSAGKTTTKEMLRACLLAVAPGKVHASEKSYNNHWGVPLTLARMPRDAHYAVFEIGMNHAGEIRPLSQMVRPHAAIITTVEAVHLAQFASVEDIADAKAEIFEGLKQFGAAIIKRDNPHYERLKGKAKQHIAKVISFGIGPEADVHARNITLGEDGSGITASFRDEIVTYHLAIPGRHNAENSLAVVAALKTVDADVASAVQALATFAPPSGRGARTVLHINGGEALLVDESYNANPASMRAALVTLATVPRSRYPRRIVVLGDMLELGPDAPNLHLGLNDAVEAAGADLVFACGPHMKGLYDAMGSAMKGGYSVTASDLRPMIEAALKPGDVVMIKASNGLQLGPVVGALKTRFAKGGSSS